MLEIKINKSAFSNIKNLEQKVANFPNRIASANDRAVASAGAIIQDDLRRRGGAGKFIAVFYKRYGKVGVRLYIKNDNTVRGGSRGSGGKKRQYSVTWATRIFLNAEEGKVGRRATTQGPRKGQGGTSRYVISRTSGRWKKGTKLKGPLKIPQIGPFFFSARRGMKREKISKMSRRVMIEELTKKYKNVRLN